jgi:GNAT superfamily N-acetyltransferase
MLDDESLMTRHIEALYSLDAGGQLLRVRERNGGPAPRFFLCRGDSTAVYRFRKDVPESVRRELADAVRSQPRRSRDDPVSAARIELARLSPILERSAPVCGTWSGPAFAFPDARQGVAVSDGAVVHVTRANAGVLEPLLAPWLPDVENSPPLMALVVGGQAVAVCGSVRITSDAHEAGVETVESHRGRGYAARVVAAWAERVRALAAEPLYSTSWDNAASRSVARQLGFVHFADDLHLT